MPDQMMVLLMISPYSRLSWIHSVSMMISAMNDPVPGMLMFSSVPPRNRLHQSGWICCSPR